VLQHVADIAEDADSHEDQAGNETVAERQRIDRLQEIDLHVFHQIIRRGQKRIQDQVADSSVIHEQHARIDRRHAEPHRDHDQRLQDFFLTEIHQKKSDKNQNDS